MSDSLRETSAQRMGRYDAASHTTQDVDVLTSAQRRRTLHKSSGEEHGQLADPDRWQKMGKKKAYLNPQQFHKMSDIEGYGALDDAAGGTVKDLIPYKQREVRKGIGDTADYPALQKAMRKGGPAGKAVPPILLEENQSGGDSDYQVGNGGHRIAIAHDMGWKMMKVTHERYDSGYGDDRFPENDRSSASSYGNSSSSGYHDPTSDYQTSSANSGEHSSGVQGWGGDAHTPKGRSHIPGFTGESEYHKGNRWHAAGNGGSKPPGEGLYSQLHPTLSSAQFGAQSEHKPGTGQPKLPGMPLHFKGGGPTDWSEYQRRNNAQWQGVDSKHPMYPEGKPTYGSAKRKVAAWADNIAAGGGGGQGGRAGQRGSVIASAQARGWNDLNSADKESRWPGGGRIATADRSTSSVRRRAAAGLT